jgi:hypothetical protein
MAPLIDFLEGNQNYYSYILFILALFVFALIARFINHFILSFVDKSAFRRRGVAEVFTPFLILIFIIAGESLFVLFFSLTKDVEKSFYYFLNMQTIWAGFWIAMAFIKFLIYEIPLSTINLRKFYPVLRILLLLILLAVITTQNYERLVATILGFVISLLLLRLTYVINNIPLFWIKKPPEEEVEKTVARWDTFNITLPYNIEKPLIDKAIKLTERCVSESNNVGERFTVLLKDFSERGIVIEVKYLVLVSTKMKETKHEILSRTLKSFAEQKIPMSTS